MHPQGLADGTDNKWALATPLGRAYACFVPCVGLRVQLQSLAIMRHQYKQHTHSCD